MEDYDLDELNFLLRVHIHAGENGEIFVSNITEAHDLTNEQGAGDMTAHRRIVSSSVFGSRRVWKKIRRFLIVVTASMIVPALILTSSLMVDDGFYLGTKIKETDSSMVRVKHHMSHCLMSIHNYVQNMRHMKEELLELEHRNELSLKYLKTIDDFLNELSLFYNKLVLDIVDLKEFIGILTKEVGGNQVMADVDMKLPDYNMAVYCLSAALAFTATIVFVMAWKRSDASKRNDEDCLKPTDDDMEGSDITNDLAWLRDRNAGGGESVPWILQEGPPGDDPVPPSDHDNEISRWFRHGPSATAIITVRFPTSEALYSNLTKRYKTICVTNTFQSATSLDNSEIDFFERSFDNGRKPINKMNVSGGKWYSQNIEDAMKEELPWILRDASSEDIEDDTSV